MYECRVIGLGPVFLILTVAFVGEFAWNDSMKSDPKPLQSGWHEEAEVVVARRADSTPIKATRPIMVRRENFFR